MKRRRSGRLSALLASTATMLVGLHCSSNQGGLSTEVQAPQDGGAESAAGSDGGADNTDSADAAAPFQIDPDRIYQDVVELASDEFAGRYPSTPGGEKSLQYIEALFRSLGLKAVGEQGFRQPFSFPLWHKLATPKVALQGTDLKEGPDFSVMLYSGSGSTTANLVFAGYGLTVPAFNSINYPNCPLGSSGYDDYAGVNAAGKIALVYRYGPGRSQQLADLCPAGSAAKGPGQLLHFGFKSVNAKLHGAAALILVQDYSSDPAPVQGTIGTSYYDAAFPVVSVHRDLIEAQLPSVRAWLSHIDNTLQPDPHDTNVSATITTQTDMQDVATANLLGAVEGSDPQLGAEAVVIGAHVDHLGQDVSTGQIYYGADDNASGTAVMMELARATVWSGLKPARTVLFASFNAEEEGLIGSCHYVRSPVYDLSHTKAMFSIDMVGAGDGTGLNLYGATRPEFTWLADLMAGAVADEGLSYRVSPQDPLDRSDHACFASQGVPALLAWSLGPHQFYHTPNDTIAHILKDDLKSSALMLWATLRPLALGQEATYLASARSRMSPVQDTVRTHDPMRAKLDRCR